jgi:ubiquinone/menaquinone biosynthesis C-methylase UbiE
MQSNRDPAEFDLIAPVYDATRRPPSEEEFQAVAQALSGTKRVLEAGVGTGRFSAPLAAKGFEMTGIDISMEMMKLARSKGLTRLFLADLHHLPFRDGSFEASLIIHVLHLIPDPALALGELARVSSDRVVAVVPDRRASDGIQRREEIRKRYREIAAEMGYEIHPRTRYWESSEKVLETLPPDHVTVIEEQVDVDQVRERWTRDMRAFGGLITVPPEVHERIVERIRAERKAEGRPARPHLRRLRVASWNARDLRSMVHSAGKV